MSSNQKICECGNKFSASRRNAKCESCREYTKCSMCERDIPKNQNRKTCVKCSTNKKKGDLPIQKTCPAIIGGKVDGKICGKKGNKKYGNEYCGKHKQDYRQSQDIKAGRIGKYCKSRTSCPGEDGYKAYLELSDKYEHCEGCRKLRQDYENGTTTECIKYNANTKNDDRKCYECPKGTIHCVSGMGVDVHGNVSNLCKRHFEQRQNFEKDRERDLSKRHDQQQEYEKRPEVIERRGQYRIDNPEKAAIGSIKHRSKKYIEDYEGQKAKNTATHTAWVDKNRDKVYEYQLQRRRTVEGSYEMYVERASRSGYDFDVDEISFEKIVRQPCHYCGCLEENRLSGIDRINNSIGYVKKNIVPCCTMCNMMKNTLNKETFILLCTRISSCNNNESTKLYTDILIDSKNITYLGYISSAERRKKIFELSVHQFVYFISRKCYMCGRKSNENHCNGIDRINNDIGYEFDNCETCCAICNFIKGAFNINDVVEKCNIIATRFSAHLDELYNNWTPSKHHEKNLNKIKLTAVDKQEREKAIKQKIYEKTMATKDPESVAKRIAELNKRALEKKNDRIRETTKKNNKSTDPESEESNVDNKISENESEESNVDDEMNENESVEESVDEDDYEYENDETDD
uniref:Uncharacterized protein n=1 Tax=viral metagenome TaxID=1070528 RepID=A0A6C0CB26_9ZZZZ